tara:strand:+ start:28539 stop:29927 length:1389 start_codon:yes stop_codon:yes gene_type:complete
MTNKQDKLKSSFRDPAGFLYRTENNLLRQINQIYKPHYEHLVTSGLYDILAQQSDLIPHSEQDLTLASTNDAYKVIKPETIPFISYPYEWSAEQLKDAALLTLDIQLSALRNNMSLKDASAYNIQFYRGKPIFIDTLSFEKYEKNKPWKAYKQFCQHFLAPLYLIKYTDQRLGQLLKNYIDGIPLDLASKLLPFRTKFHLGAQIHIHIHAKLQNKYGSHHKKVNTNNFSKQAFIHLIQGLHKTISKLSFPIQAQSEWYDYYESNNNYVEDSFKKKLEIIDSFLYQSKPSMVWDLGANTGVFSQVAAKYAQNVIAWDIDFNCIEQLAKSIKKNNIHNILPLHLDLSNPSPSIGWGNEERLSFPERGPADCTMALGLIHHLAISNNVPLNELAHFFKKISKELIIEFIPKEDSQVEKLLSSREDIFDLYDIENFEQCFDQYFSLISKQSIEGSSRTLYYYTRKG